MISGEAAAPAAPSGGRYSIRSVMRGAVGVVGVEPVEVGAAGKRSLLLHVHELPSRDDVTVARDPAEADRALRHSQYHPRAIGQAGARLDHLDPLPRRRQALDGARPSMPGEGRLRGHRESADALDDVRRGGQGLIPP